MNPFSSQPRVALSNAERWFICGAIALCFLSRGLLLRTDTISSPRRRANSANATGIHCQHDRQRRQTGICDRRNSWMSGQIQALKITT